MLASYNKPFNILLAEDDDGDAKAVLRAFVKAKIGNLIIRARDGLEALNLLKGSDGGARVTPPRILLTDLNMPRMNGVQLVTAIRKDEDDEIRNTIIFVLSTSRRAEDMKAVYDYNVAGYIVKATAGLDFGELAQLMAGYGRLVELPSAGRAALGKTGL
jgi:CheY-like chemotaxis protein